MSVWYLWEHDLLTAAHLPTGAPQQKFLANWHDNAQSNCKNNPIDISHPTTGATNCKKITATRTAKNYPSHAVSAASFYAELRSGQFPHLRQALSLDDPMQSPDPAGVVSDLKSWGSPAFAKWYNAHAVKPPTGGGGPPPPVHHTAKGHKGFHDLQVALARTLPTHLHRSKAIRGRVLRKLTR